jgi:hypothetical protein
MLLLDRPGVWCLQKRIYDLHNVGEYLVGRLGPVDVEHELSPPPLLVGLVAICVDHLSLKCNTIEELVLAATPPPPLSGHFGRDHEQDCQIRRGRTRVDGADPFEREIDRLIGEGGEDVPVAHHGASLRQSGLDLAVKVIQSVGGEKQGDGRRIHGRVSAAQYFSELLPDRPIGGLTREVAFAEVRGQASGLGGRPGPVDSFEYDQFSARPLHSEP